MKKILSYKKLVIVLIVLIILILLLCLVLLFSKSSFQTFVVTFDTLGGNTMESLKIEKRKELDMLPIPSKEGFKFVVWEDKNGTPIYDGVLLDGDISLFAVWEEENISKKYYCEKGNN